MALSVTQWFHFELIGHLIRRLGGAIFTSLHLSVNTRGLMHEGRIAALSAVIFYPAVK